MILRKRQRVIANAADSGAVEMESTSDVGGGMPMSERTRQVLSIVNESTKWAVSAAAAGFLLWKHNERAAWCILGSIFNSVTGKILKRLINQSRPPLSRKVDPGMPSSHALSLAYFGTYSSLTILLWQGLKPSAVIAAICAQALTAFFAWLRIALGYHTPAQVLVGCAVGNVVAISWLAIGERKVLPAIASPDGALLRVALFLSTTLLVVAFVAYALRKWTQDLPFFDRWRR
ncbi:lipid phosphate phosphatase [Klebsormidium nitens]|uniref:Lipid phosphate phosphatase n=1 Tax=Klebsormidium nitens TaxID=105231 RepID=A0A0U9HHK7_KLENI|nr:lipid phosphate phosphatase [Klebsormidium nitens]|eukprot:GAQ77606.1 lipid phosphate phosphatase [Klebsormidium nitens]